MINFKKIQLIVAIVLVLAGIAFVVFAIFFNRSTLQITAQAPYSFYIQGLRTESCTTDVCSTTLAPGSYKVTLSKTDYQNIDDQVTTKLGQITEQTYQFKKTPQVQAVSDWGLNKLTALNAENQSHLLNIDLDFKSTLWDTLQNLFNSTTTVKNIQISPDASQIVVDDGTQLYWQSLVNPTQNKLLISSSSGQPFSFANNSTLIYLDNNPITLAPTVYSLDLTSLNSNNPAILNDIQSSAEPKLKIKNPSAKLQPIGIKSQIITTFVRKIERAVLIANPDQSKIALIDQSDQQNTGLYIIDTQLKTRKLFDQGGYDLDLKWLSVDKFLLQKRNPVTFATEIYLGDSKQEGLALLAPLTSDLPSIAPINDHTVVFAQSFAADTQPQSSGGFNLIKYDLNSTSDSTSQQVIFSVANTAYL